MKKVIMIISGILVIIATTGFSWLNYHYEREISKGRMNLQRLERQITIDTENSQKAGNYGDQYHIFKNFQNLLSALKPESDVINIMIKDKRNILKIAVDMMKIAAIEGNFDLGVYIFDKKNMNLKYENYTVLQLWSIYYEYFNKFQQKIATTVKNRNNQELKINSMENKSSFLSLLFIIINSIGLLLATSSILFIDKLEAKENDTQTQEK